MDVSFILEFVELAEIKSFSATAYHLHLSQATLSRHIQSLERELGHPLLIRTTRNVALSDYGQVYLPFAKQIAESVREAEAATLAYEKQQDAKTIIGVSRNPDLFLATELIAGFRREYPHIQIQIFEGSLNELRREFSEGHINLVSMAYPKQEMPRHRFIPAGESCLTAIMPQDHFLAEYKAIPIRCLENVPLLVPEQTSFPFQYLLRMFRQEGIHPNIVYQGNSTGIGHLLNEGMGILIQDQAIAGTQIDERLVIRKLEPDISYIYGLEYGARLTKNERTYVNYAKTKLRL